MAREEGNDFSRMVAETIIDQLKAGTAPWVKPWKPGERWLPHNGATGKDYQGINAVWLMAVGQMRGFSDPRWMTYNQAHEQGAQVRRGEKGTKIEFWKWEDEQVARDGSGQRIVGADGKPVKVRQKLERPKVFTAVVFNANQIEGLEPLKAREVAPEWQRHDRAEALLQNSGAQIKHQARDRAFYSLKDDAITLPERDQFETPDGFYATALHELGHWTGHPSRLNRDLGHPFGSEKYAREELRAEIASLMLGQELGIGHDPGKHASYIESWIKVLQKEPREIFRASSDAQQITKFVLGLEQKHELAVCSQLGRSDLEVASAEVGREYVGPIIGRDVAGNLLQQVSEKSVVIHPAKRIGEAEMLNWARHEPGESWNMTETMWRRVKHEADRTIVDAAVGDTGLVNETAHAWKDFDRVQREAQATKVQEPVQTTAPKQADVSALIEESIEHAKRKGVTFSRVEAAALVANDLMSDEERRAFLMNPERQKEQLSQRFGLGAEISWEKRSTEGGYTTYEGSETWALLVNGVQRAGVTHTDMGWPVGYRARLESDPKAAELAYHPTLEAAQNEALRRLDPVLQGEQSWERFRDDLRTYAAESLRARSAEQVAANEERERQPERVEAAKTAESESVDVKAPVLLRESEATQVREERTYLAVPYGEKDDAKAAGARWDKEVKCWYAPEGTSLEALQRWMPQTLPVRVDLPEQHRDPRVEFAAALRESGLQIEGLPEMDGRWHRVKAEGDKGRETSGSYKGYLDGHPAGYIKNHKTQVERKWKSGVRNKVLGARDRAALVAESAQRRLEREKARELQYERVAEDLSARWSAAKPVEERDHPYLDQKEVKSFGLRADQKGNLLIPVEDAEGKLWSLQTIRKDGIKSIAKDSLMSGKFYAMGPIGTASSIIIAEGYATAATLLQETGHPTVVAFGSGNLKAVGQALREKYPEKTLIFAADNDHEREREGKQNAGRERAEEAAREVGGHVLLPRFDKGRGTDWNDLMLTAGGDEMRAQLAAGLSKVEREVHVSEQQAARSAEHATAAQPKVAEQHAGLQLV